jgi:hypothetical protein
MEKVAVLPVPDWACAITSLPKVCQSLVLSSGGGGGGGVGKLTLDDGHDGTLLDSRGALETVGVDSTEELSLQVHVVERVGDLIVVGLDLACTWVSLGSQDNSQVRPSSPPPSHCGVRIFEERRSSTGRRTHPRAHPQDLCQPYLRLGVATTGAGP